MRGKEQNVCSSGGAVFLEELEHHVVDLRHAGAKLLKCAFQGSLLEFDFGDSFLVFLVFRTLFATPRFAPFVPKETK